MGTYTDWVSASDADTYFSTRIGAESWEDLTATQKAARLTTAYNRIYFDPRWTIPATPSATEKAKLAFAVEETAWFMHGHMEDEDRRKGLQAQAVISAGIVQESYDKDRAATIPLPPAVEALLDDSFTTKKSFYAIDIDRREPVGTDQDVTDVDNSLNDPGVY